jgi:hypothetical protein
VELAVGRRGGVGGAGPGDHGRKQQHLRAKGTAIDAFHANENERRREPSPSG